MSLSMTRRHFFKRFIGYGAMSYLWKNLSTSKFRASGKIPLIITSNSNETGKRALEIGWKILSQGGSALDAVEKAANVIELDPEDTGVGYGGLPNEDGVIQLDASIMDGKTYNAGAVACLENIKTPCSVARIIMEHTDHILLVGKDALNFAKKWGFKEEDLMTDKARKIWLQWKESHSDKDDWGPPEHLTERKNTPEKENQGLFEHGTVNVLAVDKKGDIAGVTTTSGLSFKIPGRVGDSPILGAGLYVDNEVGAAGATGRGEDVIKSCSSFYIVLRMKEGKSPQQACEDALRMIAEKYKKINPGYLPWEKFVAINKAGEFGCSTISDGSLPKMSLMNEDGYRIMEGTVAYKIRE